MLSKISFNNHPILGNLSIDFLGKDGSLCKNVVLIGENGSGKTTLLQCIDGAVGNGILNNISYIEFKYNETKYNINKSTSGSYLDSSNVSNPFHSFNRSNSYLTKQPLVFSSTRTNFEIDYRNYQNKDDIDVATHLSDVKQNYSTLLNLFYNLQNLDNEQFTKLNKSSLNITFDDFNKQQSRLSRFQNAFNSFFTDLKLEKIQTDDIQNIRVFFSKFDKEIEIDQLSSGEKQIVFRGANILKSKDIMKDGIILIDEPELSLHPEWQSKILKFYRDIFTINGSQFAQIILASHSENVVKAAFNSRDDTIIIKLIHSPGGVIATRLDDESVLPSVTSDEANYLVFGTCGIDYHSQLFCYLQDLANKDTVSKIDDFIKKSKYYDKTIHFKQSSYKNINYETLPSFIRNKYNHSFQNGDLITSKELNNSISLLRQIIVDLRNKL